MFVSMTICKPAYGPEGQPFCVTVRFPAGGTRISHFWTEREALDSRDAAFDAGAHSVHICGLPFRAVAVAPDKPPHLQHIED